MTREDKKYVGRFRGRFNSGPSIASKELLKMSLGKNSNVHFENCMHNDYTSDEE